MIKNSWFYCSMFLALESLYSQLLVIWQVCWRLVFVNETDIDYLLLQVKFGFNAQGYYIYKAPISIYIYCKNDALKRPKCTLIYRPEIYKNDINAELFLWRLHLFHPDRKELATMETMETSRIQSKSCGLILPTSIIISIIIWWILFFYTQI